MLIYLEKREAAMAKMAKETKELDDLAKYPFQIRYYAFVSTDSFMKIAHRHSKW